MSLFPVILAANFVTFLATVIAAIRFPTWSYRLIGVVALCAFLLALHQFVTGQYHPAALLFTALSAGLITLRVMASCWRSRRGR
jgi:hypothetical protein